MGSLGEEADRSAEQQIRQWTETSALLLICTSMVYISEMLNLPLLVIIVPVALLEIKQVVSTLMHFPKLIRYIPVSLQGRRYVVCELLVHSCNLLFILACVTLFQRVYTLLIVTPLLCKVCLRVFMRISVKSECSSFSELVGAIQIRCSIVVVQLLSLTFVALKTDSLLELTWNAALWPCWLLELVLFVISTGVFLLFIGAVCTWAVNEAETIEVFACAWLLFSVTGATICFGLALTELVDYLEGIEDQETAFLSPRLIFVQGFLLLFVIMTVCNEAKLA